MTRTDRILTVGTVLTCAVFTFPVVLAVLATGPLFYYHVLFLMVDIPLAFVGAAVCTRALTSRVRPNAEVSAALGLLAALAVALAVHPSPQGVQIAVRLAAALGLAVALVWIGDRGAWPVVVAAFAAGAIAQAGLGVVEVVTRRPVALPSFELADPLYRVGSQVAPRGTTYHQYILAALALLAGVMLIAQGLRSERRARWWSGAAAAAAVPVGLTYSRAALGGLLLVVALLAWSGRARPRAHALAIAALLLGAGIPALVTFDGWTAQADKGLELNSRDVLIREGLDLFATAPLTGIGPGRMVIALQAREREQPGSVKLLQPTHGVPILLVVEGGVQAAVLCCAIIGLVAWRARTSGVALALVAAYLPFVVLDHFPYTHAEGLILSAIWLGAVEVSIRHATTRVRWT